MDVDYTNRELARLEAEPDYTGGYNRAIARAFRKVMILLRSVQNETELYRFKSLRFEKLKGDRSHERSLRLNQQWRLIIEIREAPGGNCLIIKAIEDYH